MLRNEGLVPMQAAEFRLSCRTEWLRAAECVWKPRRDVFHGLSVIQTAFLRQSKVQTEKERSRVTTISVLLLRINK